MTFCIRLRCEVGPEVGPQGTPEVQKERCKRYVVRVCDLIKEKRPFALPSPQIASCQTAGNGGNLLKYQLLRGGKH